MKNIQGTEGDLELFNENGTRVYAYLKDSGGVSYEHTYDSSGKILTYKNSDGYSYEYTYDSNGKVLTYKNSDGESKGFDKTYTPEEVVFMKSGSPIFGNLECTTSRQQKRLKTNTTNIKQMKIKIKHLRVTYSIETKEDNLNATEMLETFTNLMKCIGFQQSSIDGAIMELNEQIDL